MVTTLIGCSAQFKTDSALLFSLLFAFFGLQQQAIMA